MSVFHTILVPLDGSALSDRVLDAALATAAWSGASLVLLHVEHEPASLAPVASDLDLNVIERRIDDLLAAAHERSGIPTPPRDRIRAEVRAGNVVDAIEAAVAEVHADLVVMGTHGRDGLVDNLLGSTTERALRRVPASVFVVRPEGWPFLRE
ncbi:MAG: universal stress protein [Alphaproteobacteria bacterium]|nr:universal stress protein [Alphaproteobacteria bacterium]